MVVIGNMYDDEPADLAGVLFIRQPNGHLHDPRVVETVIAGLRSAGDGHLYTGFQVWHDRAQALGHQIPHGGLLAMSMDGMAICVAEQPPRPQRRTRLGPVSTPTVTLLAWP
jgi:hypothetical protein